MVEPLGPGDDAQLPAQDACHQLVNACRTACLPQPNAIVHLDGCWAVLQCATVHRAAGAAADLVMLIICDVAGVRPQ